MIDISALHSTQLRNTLVRRAANRAVDKAMRGMHDMPTFARVLNELTGMPAEITAEVAAARFHERMKTNESNCRWCGEAQRDALAELEEDDG